MQLCRIGSVVTVLGGRKRITVYRVPVNPLFVKSMVRSKIKIKKKYIYIYTLGKPGNFHILIKLDNSICIEDEDSKPIEHVRSSSKERERKNETRNDRQREGKKWSKINFNQLLPRFSLIYLLIHTCLVL